MVKTKNLKFDGTCWWCQLCTIPFASKDDLISHCENSGLHEWCDRCVRVFKTSRAKEDHIVDSSSHNICFLCGWDIGTKIQLDIHLETGHFTCATCLAFFDSVLKVKAHKMIAHAQCPICRRGFENENELRMHKQVHQPRELKCYGCPQKFKTLSGMSSHLESGICPSGVDKTKLDQIAHKCYQKRKYTTKDIVHPYKCPGCSTEFTKLSGLLQHAEDSLLCFMWTIRPNCLAKLKVFMKKEIKRTAKYKIWAEGR